jgi:trimeric autotransporter adhesin
MKQLFIIAVITSVFIAEALKAQNTFPSSGAAGIGTTAPNASSLLEVSSTTKGMLVPRMTQTQRNAIATPATGLLIYQTTNTTGFYYYTGSTWTALKPSKANLSLNNLTSPTAVNVDLLPGTNNSRDLGSSSLNWRTMYAGSYCIGSTKVLELSGANNTFVGATGNTVNTGTYNTAIGNQAFHFNTSGINNTATGAFALYSNTSGASNSAYGYGALYTNMGSSNNTAIGAYSLAYNTSGSGNTAIGAFALNANTIGVSNTASGNNALHNNTEGFTNTADGADALSGNTTGYLNTATGSSALNANTTGFYNTANGGNALKSNVNGVGNTATGAYTLYANNSGAYNSAHGSSALANNTSGIDNTADGVNALAGNTSGNYNTSIGYGSLQTNSTGHHNTAAGYYADVSGDAFSNATAIGDNASVNAGNKIRLGNGAVTVIEGTVGYTVSDARFKTNITDEVKGLEFINKLHPVVYNFEAKKFDEFLHKNNLENFEKNSAGIDYSEAEHIRYSGFIAQEVERAANETNYNFNGVHVPKNDDDNYSLAYSEFVVPLVKAVQELDKANAELKTRNAELKSEIKIIKSVLSNEQQQKIRELSENKLPVNGISQGLLEQNTPNPFTENTVINYYISHSVTAAKIIVTDISGQPLKSFGINQPGYGKIIIHANELAAGSYLYSLITDGIKTESRRMELLK